MSEIERRLAAVLAEHAWLSSDEQKIGDEWTWGFHCDCGGFVPDADANAHLATALLPVVAEIEAEARAEALREAADALVSEFRNDGFPADWLRGRADAIAHEETQ